MRPAARGPASLGLNAPWIAPLRRPSRAWAWLRAYGNFFSRLRSQGLGQLWRPGTTDVRTLLAPIRAQAAHEAGSGPRADADADAEAVAQFKAGHESGFNRLVLRHKDKVYTLCFRMLGNRDQALDVAQEVFVRVYRSLGAFRGEARFSTWLHGIALNACRNRQASAGFRRDSYHESLEHDGSGEERFSAIDRQDRSGSEEVWGSPEQDLIRKRRERLLQQALASLPVDFRQALVLRDVEGRSYEEIAELSRWELGTVRSRIHRAREKLREALKDAWE